MVQLLDKVENDLQRKLALQSFFSSAIYKEYEEELEGQQQTCKVTVDSYLRSNIDANKLSKLNFEMGMKAGLELALNALKGLKEELQGESA